MCINKQKTTAGVISIINPHTDSAGHAVHLNARAITIYHARCLVVVDRLQTDVARTQCGLYVQKGRRVTSSSDRDPIVVVVTALSCYHTAVSRHNSWKSETQHIKILVSRLSSRSRLECSCTYEGLHGYNANNL